MRLRRLVIGEASRFPELAAVLYDRGPLRAITALAVHFDILPQLRLLRIDSPREAASLFNWLIMGEPLNRAMLLGDGALMSGGKLRAHAARAVRVFLQAYRAPQ